MAQEQLKENEALGRIARRVSLIKRKPIAIISSKGEKIVVILADGDNSMTLDTNFSSHGARQMLQEGFPPLAAFEFHDGILEI